MVLRYYLMYVTRYINYSITSYYIHVLLSIKGTSLELTFEMTLWRPILSRRTALVRVFVLTSGDNNFHILNGYNTVINQPPAYRRLAVNRGVRGGAAGWCGVNLTLRKTVIINLTFTIILYLLYWVGHIHVACINVYI